MSRGAVQAPVDPAERARWARVALEKSRADFVWFFENLVRIRDKQGKLVSPKINPPQRKVWGTIKADLDAGRRAMVLALKARQQGITTLAMAILAWRICCFPGQGGLHVNYREKEGKQALEKLYEIIENLPPEIRPRISKGSQYGDIIRLEPLKSFCMRDSAENIEVGRGMTIQTYHLTEFPWWRNPLKTMGSLLPSVPDRAGIIVLGESTGEIVGDYLYDLFIEGMRPLSAWTSVFTAWFESPEYQILPRATKQERAREVARRLREKPLTQWEKDKMRQFGVSEAQMLWYRDKLAEFNGDETEMRRAYPFTWEEAFAVGGRLYFNREAIEKYAGIVASSKPLREGFISNGEFMDSPDGDWRIYRRAVPGRAYIISGDVAAGTSRDFSSADILDAVTLDQVASFRGKVDPDEFAVQLAGMGYAYNTALIACERNNEGRSTNIVLRKRLNYPRLFQHMPEDRAKTSISEEVGWLTSTRTRPVMLSQLSELTRTFEVTIRDPRTVAEMRTFVWPEKSDKPQATPGGWDDSVMSLAIGCSSEVRSQAYAGSAEYDEGDFEPAVSTVTGW